MLAPVATMASTMLYFTRSAYNCMQPPAEVEPAIVKIIEQVLSCSMRLKICVARARSRELKDILSIASIMGRASNEAMSMCSTAFFSKSFFFMQYSITKLKRKLRHFCNSSAPHKNAHFRVLFHEKSLRNAHILTCMLRFLIDFS